MQAMHAYPIAVALQRYTAGPPTAKRVLDEAVLLLDAGGYRMGRGGRFFTIPLDDLDRVLERAAGLTGVPLISDAERDERIKARARARGGRDWL
ncbi:MAG: hypothetical protein ACOYLQ_09615 [Hyphomicrobiaceae bacterium]